MTVQDCPVSGMYYKPEFILKADADRLFERLMLLPWSQHRLSGILARRKYAWMGLPPSSTSYTGGTPGMYGEPIKILDWTPETLEIRDRVRQETGHLFTSLNLNLYRNETDRLGFHADREDEGLWTFPSRPSPLGRRDFQIQQYRMNSRKRLVGDRWEVIGQSREEYGPIYTTRLEHGSFILMPTQMQAGWVHRIKEQRARAEARINLTFRMMPEVAK